MVNKKHYYFSVVACRKIEDAFFADYQNRYERDQVMKNVWNRYFKLYNETENILEKMKDPMCELFPLYRDLGCSDEDYVFESREQAEREYSDHIDECIADRLYDL